VACTLVTALIAAASGTHWLAVACVLWAVLTAASGFRQLGMLQQWQGKSLAEVAETISNAGSTYFRGRGYESLPNDGNKREVEGGLGFQSFDGLPHPYAPPR